MESLPHFTLMDPNFKNIDVGNFSRPTLSYVNNDNFVDLLIGEQDQGINLILDSSAGNFDFKYVKNNLL